MLRLYLSTISWCGVCSQRRASGSQVGCHEASTRNLAGPNPRAAVYSCWAIPCRKLAEIAFASHSQRGLHPLCRRFVNNRPIAVGKPPFNNNVHKLYTIILRRLIWWSEQSQLRNPIPAGFRPRQSPIHHLSALCRFLNTAGITKRPLYACSMGFQKAYDAVHHHLLRERPESFGVDPRMLAAIIPLYSSCTPSMKVVGTAGQP